MSYTVDYLTGPPNGDLQQAISDASAVCPHCGKFVFWALTRNRKLIPFDPEPRPGGRFTIRRVEGGFACSYIDQHDYGMHVQNHGQPPVAFVSHQKTCKRG